MSIPNAFLLLLLLFASCHAQQTSTSQQTATQGGGQASAGVSATTGVIPLPTTPTTSTSTPPSQATQQQGATTTMPSSMPTTQPVNIVNNTFPLQPFTRIALCAPYNILVQPTPADATSSMNYTVTVGGDQQTINAVNATVGPNGVLQLSTAANISTGQPIEVTVNLPASALSSISHFGPGATVYIAPGFDTLSLAIDTSFGARDIIAPSITVRTLNIQSLSNGNVIMGGKINSVAAVSSGGGFLSFTGVESGVQLVLSDLATASISQGPASTITGSVSGLNTVQYEGGKCQLSSPFAFAGLSVCQPVTGLQAPKVTPVWTCGLVTQGNFQCVPGTVVDVSGTGTTASQPLASPVGSTRTFSTSGPGMMQTGFVAPGNNAGASSSIAASGPGSISSSSFASSSSSGGSQSSTSTTQNGQTTSNQVTGGTTVNTGSGGGTSQSSGTTVAVNYGQGMTATAKSDVCQVASTDLMIPVQGF